MSSRLLDHTLLSAHDPKTGRYDARRLAATLEITGREMAEIVGYTPTGLSKNPASPRLQPKLSALVQLLNRLRELLDGRMDLVLVWLKAPHPYLDGATPLSYLEAGKAETVETLVYMIETGQPG
jgi:hypothetical protein